jgi:hypothetical protein
VAARSQSALRFEALEGAAGGFQLRHQHGRGLHGPGAGLDLDDHMLAGRMRQDVERATALVHEVIDIPAQGARLRDLRGAFRQPVAQEFAQRPPEPRVASEHPRHVAGCMADFLAGPVRHQHHAMRLDRPRNMDRLARAGIEVEGQVDLLRH